MKDRYNREINKIIISLGRNSILSIDDLKFIIDGLCKLGINDIDLDLEDNIEEIRLYELINYIKNTCKVDYIGVITDGFGIESRISKLKSYGLSNISLRLESLKQYKYKKLNHNININEVLETMYKCINAKLNTKIICTLIKDFNTDEILDFVNLSKFLPVEISFSELIPNPNDINLFKNGYVNIEEIIKKIDGLQELNYVNLRRKYYKLPDSKGIVSLDTHNNLELCKGCNELFLDCNGYIKTCIHSSSGIDVKNYINKPLMFKEILKETISSKNKNSIESGAYYG